ncbi:MAG TPA: L,D-transpeptidase family protein [Chlamydiales bacterium]|nr:L,D-transpeptidase family protein [Chlamydiales bacterium]
MKYFIFGTVLLFGAIGVMGWMKREPKPVVVEKVQEIALGTTAAPIPLPVTPKESDEFPEVDRIDQLFDLYSDKLPIVETVSFTSRVPWLKDRPAWIADYAAHYETSRHFIARGLNRKADYFTQKVCPGDQFNVFKKDKNLRFHLLVDLTHCRMWFYYIDLDNNERVLLKTYRVGLGKMDSQRASGSLTPVGKYELGEKIVIYKPGIMGFFQDQKVEMIRVFGTRWLPFEKEIEGCSETAKGYGLHGSPWVEGPDGQLVEDRSKIGKYDSDGCIRLNAEDVEEIFSIVVTKPTTVEIVKDFKMAKLPGFERNLP